MTLFKRDDGSLAEHAQDTIQDGADKLQWWATTWFKSSAASVGAVVLIFLAGLAIFVCRPWRQSVKAEKKLAKIRQELLLNAMEDPETNFRPGSSASGEVQPLMSQQGGSMSFQPSMGQPVPPPPKIPARPGMRPVQTGLGNTQGMSMLPAFRQSLRSQPGALPPSSSSRPSKGGLRPRTRSEDDDSSSGLSDSSGKLPWAGPQLQRGWGREHSTDAQLPSFHPAGQ